LPVISSLAKYSHANSPIKFTGPSSAGNSRGQSLTVSSRKAELLKQSRSAKKRATRWRRPRALFNCKFAPHGPTCEPPAQFLTRRPTTSQKVSAPSSSLRSVTTKGTAHRSTYLTPRPHSRRHTDLLSMPCVITPWLAPASCAQPAPICNGRQEEDRDSFYYEISPITVAMRRSFILVPVASAGLLRC